MDLNEAKVRVSKYLSNDDSQESFRSWLASTLWDPSSFGTEVEAFLASVELEFAKCARGTSSPKQMREQLAAIVAAPGADPSLVVFGKPLVETGAFYCNYQTRSSFTPQWVMGPASMTGQAQILRETEYA